MACASGQPMAAVDPATGRIQWQRGELLGKGSCLRASSLRALLASIRTVPCFNLCAVLRPTGTYGLVCLGLNLQDGSLMAVKVSCAHAPSEPQPCRL